MSIDGEDDLHGLRRIGRIVARTLRLMMGQVEPGMRTDELDAIGRRELEHHGAKAAPSLVYDFPGTTCISVEDEAAHGIPGPRVLRQGELVNIDVSAELDGYFADTGASMAVGDVTRQKQRLCQTTQRALHSALRVARAGRPMNGIGKAIQSQARRGGFNVIKNLAGHGVGRSIHEYPDGLTSYCDPTDRRRFGHGLVVAIEPFLSTGAEWVERAADGWTEKTTDGSVTAQFEHTVVVTRGKPLIMTLP